MMADPKNKPKGLPSKPGKVPKGDSPSFAFASVPKSSRARVIESIVVNRQQSINYANQVGADRVVSVLRSAIADLELRLAMVPKSLIDDGAFTPTAMRATMLQLEDLVAQLVMPGVAGGVVDSMRVGAALGQVDGLQNLMMMDSRFMGIASLGMVSVARQLDTKGKGPSSTVLRRLATQYPDEKPGKGIMERYGLNVIEKFEEKLMVAAISSKPWTEVREDLIDESTWLQDSPMYWAQRIVRSECMGAYNESILENGELANEIVGGDMVKILVAAFDDRTGWDSYQVHGQIRNLDEPFEWVDRNGNTIAYMTPPNRPNDREVIVFHRLAWPIPDDLLPVPDSVYEMRFSEQNKSGSAPSRPVMSTVDLDRFGSA